MSVDSDGVVGNSEAGLDGPTDMHFALSDWTVGGRSSNTRKPENYTGC